MKRNLKQSEVQKKKSGKIPRKNIKFLIAFVFFFHLIFFFLMCVRSLFSLLLAGEMAFFVVVVVVVDDNWDVYAEQYGLYCRYFQRLHCKMQTHILQQLHYRNRDKVMPFHVKNRRQRFHLFAFEMRLRVVFFISIVKPSFGSCSLCESHSHSKNLGPSE